MMRQLMSILLAYAGIPFLACISCLSAALLDLPYWTYGLLVPGFTVLIYLLLRRRLNLPLAVKVNAISLALLSLFLFAAVFISSGNAHGPAYTCFEIAAIPFVVLNVLMRLTGNTPVVFIVIPLTYTAGLAVSAVLCGKADPPLRRPRLWLPLLCVCISAACCAGTFYLYSRRPEVRYSGHGFAYMNGYSSTDFSDYMVYAEPSKLAALDHEPALVIEREEDMPVMDGAEACYPLYAALAKAVYRDIAQIELRPVADKEVYLNGRVVSFSNSVVGFERLLLERIDLFFGARPSADQLSEAKERNVELEITEIGREGFVFFVEEDNPVDNLTSEQIKAIYHGDIVNWKEVGGPDQEIRAFQRPANSGSQTMMEYFMGDISLKEPETYETVDSMDGVLEHVAQYAGEEGALGYSFRYFLEGLSQEEGVKLLSVDGVAPTLENIENGSYPLPVPLCLVTRRDNDNPYVEKMREFILSDEGQEIVRKTGYAGR